MGKPCDNYNILESAVPLLRFRHCHMHVSPYQMRGRSEALILKYTHVVHNIR